MAHCDFRRAQEGLPVGLAIPLAHAGEDACGGWHVQPHGKGLSRKQALQHQTISLQQIEN